MTNDYRLDAPASDRLQQEILEQPDALARLLDGGHQRARSIAESIRAYDPEWVLIAARGSSENAARYAQHLFGVRHQLIVALAAPSVATLYLVVPKVRKALVIGISQSGQSPDVVCVLEQSRRSGALTLCITNDEQSPLAMACELTMPILAGEEISIAATKSYTNELLALAMISSALQGGRGSDSELERLPEWVRWMIASGEEPLHRAVEASARGRGILVIARGFAHGAGREIALKIQELTNLPSQAFSVADFLHGPCAMVDDRFLTIAIVPDGPTVAELPHVLGLLEARQVPLVAISNVPEVLERANYGIRTPQGVPEWLSPIVSVVPGQKLARALCLTLAMSPDAPRGLSKVTRTL